MKDICRYRTKKVGGSHVGSWKRSGNSLSEQVRALKDDTTIGIGDVL
jgi:hypothetical protein